MHVSANGNVTLFTINFARVNRLCFLNNFSSAHTHSVQCNVKKGILRSKKVRKEGRER